MLYDALEHCLLMYNVHLAATVRYPSTSRSSAVRSQGVVHLVRVSDANVQRMFHVL